MRIALGSLVIVIGCGLGPSSAARAATATQSQPAQSAAALQADGEAAMEASRFADAEAAFTRLVALRPGDAVAQLRLGMSRAMGGKAAEAIAPLRESLRLRPDLLPARLFLGIAYLESGRPKEALGPLRQVVAAGDDGGNARQALAEALLAVEEYAEASTHLGVLAGAQPHSPQVLAALGRSYEGVAREAFAALQAQEPDSPYVWLLVADVLAVQEKYPQAFDLLRKAQAVLPTLPGVH
ncbi:MAG: tetratricopeptide repeat protein, partial [Acidobacteria bacterium]|nr:tetratricopeptide repeat protein [Acidobacteriota bacterium]